MSVEKVQRDITNLFNYPSDENPTTQADYITAVKNWVETIVNLVDCNLWQPETNYSVGNYLRTPSLPSQVVLRCVTAGISGTEEPDYTDAEIGDTIADGSVEWTIQTMASLNELDAYFAEIIQRIENGEGVVDTMWETDLETDIQPISATNVVPKVNGTGTLGTSLKKWANVYADGLTISGTATATTPTAGDNSTKVATTEFIQALASILVPTGCVQAFAGQTTPSGWLLCDGSAVSRTDYAGLYAVIGDTYGAGDGSTTFNLPNLVDKFVEGSATSGTVKSAGLPNITGSTQARWESGGFYAGFYNPTGSFYAEGDQGKNAARGTGDNGGLKSLSFDASRSSSIYGNSTTVQPPALTMRYVIKY